MAKPVFLITLGALAGASVAMIHGAGMTQEVVDKLSDSSVALTRLLGSDGAASANDPAADAPADPETFSRCLRKSGDDLEHNLRDLVEFHEHDATLNLVECLLNAEPRRFCGPDGGQQAADAMEIYLWSRDDARHTSPAHGLADKIHLLDRAAQTGRKVEDPFLFTWSGPRDRAIFDKLKTLVKDGYLDPGAFAFSGRAELREALRDVKVEASPCNPVARE